MNDYKGGGIMSGIQRTALVLTIIGAINWGLIGFFQFDLVAAIFGGQDGAFSRLIYSLVRMKPKRVNRKLRLNAKKTGSSRFQTAGLPVRQFLLYKFS